MHEEGHLLVAEDGPIATFTMNHPEKRNALSRQMVASLKAAFEAVRDRTDIRVIVLTGTGSAFSSGLDLDELRRLQSASPEDNREDSSRLADLFEEIYQFTKPVIARVNGHAVAGGCGLAAACDFAVAVSDARLGVTEVRIGFVPALVAVLLRRKLRDAALRELLLTGKLVSAARAAEIGLILRAVEPGRLEETVSELAMGLAYDTSSTAVGLTMQLLTDIEGMTFKAGLDYAAEVNATARTTDDCKAGVQAFLDKRDPPWKQKK